MEPEDLLLPAPRRLERRPESWCLPPRPRLATRGALERGSPGLRRLERALGERDRELDVSEADGAAELRLELDATLAPEAYRLAIGADGVRLVASGAAGLDYALYTLAQWLEATRAQGRQQQEVPALEVEDAPDFPERGVMLDVARDKRPTLATLFELVERFAGWKLNRLELYMEADFAYSDAEEVLADRSPYTAAELRELDAHCRAHHVELVPNQQSLGHFHAWLRHERFRPLAEVPEGVEHPFSRECEPFSLAAARPDVLAFLDRLYAELLPCFASRELNVGLDECFDLGRGSSADACRERGVGSVYLEHLRAVAELAGRHGRRIRYWGDIVLEHPERIPELPPEATALVWGYEADFPFEERLPAFAAAELPFVVCPGTSSWNSFGGRVVNALGNLRKAAREARAHGARGLLVTDWGDRGHLQALPASFPGWLAAAALAWRVDAAEGLDLERLAALLDRHAFEDASGALGRACVELGRTEEVLGDDCVNGHALFFATTFADAPFPHPRVVGLSQAGLATARAHLEGALDGLADARSARADASLVADELRLARDELLLAVRFCELRLAAPEGHSLADLPGAELAPLRADLDGLLEQHRALWGRRNRPGGLAASLAWLDFLRTS